MRLANGMNPIRTQKTTSTNLTSEHVAHLQPSSNVLTESEFNGMNPIRTQRTINESLTSECPQNVQPLHDIRKVSGF